jgi:hypothetical protein
VKPTRHKHCINQKSIVSSKLAFHIFLASLFVKVQANEVNRELESTTTVVNNTNMTALNDSVQLSASIVDCSLPSDHCKYE